MNEKHSHLERPFAHLEQTPKENEIAYETAFDLASLTPESVKRCKALIVLGMDIALHASSLDSWYTTLKMLSKSTPVFFWNHEPFWDVSASVSTTLFGRDVHFFNAHLKNVYFTPFSVYFGVGGYLWSNSRLQNIPLPSKQILRDRFEKSDRRACAYASCFHDKQLKIASSIVRERNDLIKAFYMAEVCDVYERGWTNNWQLEITEETRSGRSEGDSKESWGYIKVEKSKSKYSFSISLENCLIDNYDTEKFAHAIESNILPIYCSGNRLEQYIDISPSILINTKKAKSQAAIEVMTNMSFSEYYDRIGLLNNSYNQLLVQTAFIDSERRRPAREFIKKVQELI